MFGQAQQSGELLQQLDLLSWVDRTALGVLFVFFVLGLFKGLFWQVSRIAILLASYLVAGRFGGAFGDWLARDGGPSDTVLYLAYLTVFLATLILLSLIAMQIQRLVKKTGLGFFDRIAGGLFGIATGACTVLFFLFVLNMFFRDTTIWREAEASHSQRLSRQAIDWLGPRVPDELRSALELAPLRSPPKKPPSGEVPGEAPPEGERRGR